MAQQRAPWEEDWSGGTAKQPWEEDWSSPAPPSRQAVTAPPASGKLTGPEFDNTSVFNTTNAARFGTSPLTNNPITRGLDKIGGGFIEGLKNVAAMPGAIYDAAMTPASTPTEEHLSMVPLVLKRLVADPSAENIKSWWETAKKDPISAQAAIATVKAVPMVGPVVAGLMEKTAKGDPLGALGEGTAYIAAGKASEAAVKAIPKVSPTAAFNATIDKFKPSPVITMGRAVGGSSPDLMTRTLPKVMDELKAWELEHKIPVDNVPKARIALDQRMTNVYNPLVEKILEPQKHVEIPGARAEHVDARIAAIPDEIRLNDPARYRAIVKEVQETVGKGPEYTVGDLDKQRQAYERKTKDWDKSIATNMTTDASMAALDKASAKWSIGKFYDSLDEVSGSGVDVAELKSRIGAIIETKGEFDKRMNRSIIQSGQSLPAKLVEGAGHAMRPGKFAENAGSGVGSMIDKDIASAMRRWKSTPAEIGIKDPDLFAAALRSTLKPGPKGPVDQFANPSGVAPDLKNAPPLRQSVPAQFSVPSGAAPNMRDARSPQMFPAPANQFANPSGVSPNLRGAPPLRQPVPTQFSAPSGAAPNMRDAQTPRTNPPPVDQFANPSGVSPNMRDAKPATAKPVQRQVVAQPTPPPPEPPAAPSFDREAFEISGHREVYTVTRRAPNYPAKFTTKADAEAFAKKTGRKVTTTQEPIWKRKVAASEPTAPAPAAPVRTAEESQRLADAQKLPSRPQYATPPLAKPFGPLVDNAGTMEFKAGPGPITLGANTAEAMRLAAGGRRAELLKEGKIFDEQAVVNSPLFQGRGGAQGFLGIDARAETPAPVKSRMPPAAKLGNAYFKNYADEAGLQLMKTWATEIEGADTSLTGKAQKLEAPERRNYEDPNDAGAGRRRFGGGYKEGTPLEDFKESPGVLAKAIRSGKGRLYDEILEAFRKAAYEERLAFESRAKSALASEGRRRAQAVFDASKAKHRPESQP